MEMKAGFYSANEQSTQMKEQISHMEGQVSLMREQIGFLHEGQTEMKNLLKQKADQADFAGLEMRVTRLENKVA